MKNSEFKLCLLPHYRWPKGDREQGMWVTDLRLCNISTFTAVAVHHLTFQHIPNWLAHLRLQPSPLLAYLRLHLLLCLTTASLKGTELHLSLLPLIFMGLWRLLQFLQPSMFSLWLWLALQAWWREMPSCGRHHNTLQEDHGRAMKRQT